VDNSGGPTPSRRFAVLLAAIPLLAVGLADGALLIRRATDGSPGHRPAAAGLPTTTRTAQGEQHHASVRAAAIRALLARRSDAVLRHDRATWMSTIDPKSKRFRRHQADVFTNLRHVPFASWSYSFVPGLAQLPNAKTRRYGVTAWAPTDFALHYRLRGFDRKPTNLAQYPTFVHRGGEWFLASLSDFAGTGTKSARDVWDFGPVVALRTPSVLVLGHPQSASLMQSLAIEVAADIPRVNAVWGKAWARKAVVLAPATQHELSQVVGDFGNLDHIAAVASAEVSVGSGKPDPVGDRIGINPSNWAKLSSLGRRIVLTHELTHVATRAVTSSSTPTWLAEGFADYIGYLGSGVPTTFVAQELGSDVKRGHVPHRLPVDGQFDGSSKRLSQAYEGAWLACRLIAQRWGERALVRFYAGVGRSHAGPRLAVSVTMNRLFHESPATFVSQWRDFLRSELA
jgi:hypothetical protein